MLLPVDPVIRVGDRLRIVCPEAPEICIDRTVGPDGTVDLPGIGPLPAAVRRPSDLARGIADRLPFGPLSPRVEVRWLGPSASEVSVQGAIKTPLRLYAPRGIAADRLFAAAGLLPEADGTLLGVSGRVRPGTALDVPLVAAERRISVLGAVANPKGLAPAVNLLLESALEAAGGLTLHADPNGIVVVREGEPIPVQLPADRNFRLQPGDLVRVGLLAERHIVVVRGLVARPGAVDYAPGLTAKGALAAAGGTLALATNGALVWQTGAKTFRLSLAFLSNGRIPDPRIGANDTLTVEATRP